VDAVLHNAAKAGQWGSKASYFDANVRGTDNVIAACRSNAIARLVYTSTPSVTHSGRTPVEGGNEANTPYGEHFKAWYPASKKIAEQRLLAANDGELATVALRPRLIWGPGDTQLLPRLVDRAVAGRLRFVGDGDNRMDTTFVENAVDAHLRALDTLQPAAACAGRAYFISNGEPLSAREIVNDLLRAADAPEVDKSIPFAAAYAAGAVLEPGWPPLRPEGRPPMTPGGGGVGPEWERGFLCAAGFAAGAALGLVWGLLRLEGEPPMTRFLAEQLSTPHWYDISAAERDFGYRPRVSVADGLALTAAWWRRENAPSR